MTVKALKKKNNMKPFKLRSGNKPSMAKLAGVSPMRDMIKEEESKLEKIEKNRESKMDQVYAEVTKKMGDTGGGYTARDVAGMSEKERVGNIDGYEPGSFQKLMNAAKEKFNVS